MATHYVYFRCVLRGKKWSIGFYARQYNDARAAVDALAGDKSDRSFLGALRNCMHPAGAIIAVGARRVADETTDTPRRDQYSRRLQGQTGLRATIAGTGVGRAVQQTPISSIGQNFQLVGGAGPANFVGDGGPDVTNVTAKVRMWIAGNPPRSRLVDVSGLADGVTVREVNGQTTWPPDLAQPLDALIAAIIAARFYLRYPKPETTVGPFAWQDVPSFYPEAGSEGAQTEVGVRTPTGHGLVAGNRIEIRGPRDPDNLPLLGTHKVLAVRKTSAAMPAPDLLVVAARYVGQDFFSVPHRMRLRRTQWNYAALTSGERSHLSTRDRGDQVEGTRGRARSLSRRR